MLREQAPRVGDRFVLPVAGEVIRGHERARQHAVDVEGSVEVIDLVLQDAGMPAGRVDYHGLAIVIQTFHAGPDGAGNDGAESGHAEASFEEFNACRLDLNDRIDNYGERDRPAVTLGKRLRVQPLEQVLTIFDYRELKREADLWRGKADTRRIAHSLAHKLDELAAGFRTNLIE